MRGDSLDVLSRHAMTHLSHSISRFLFRAATALLAGIAACGALSAARVPEAAAGAREEMAAGLAAHEKGDLDEAIRRYSRAIDAGGDDAETLASAYYNRGIARRARGANGAAIEDYTRAIALEPGFAMAYSNRGLAYAKGERYDLAVADFDRAIADYGRAVELDPGFARAHCNRCDALDRKGEREAAARDCARALELDPGAGPPRRALEWLRGPREGARPAFCN